MQVRALVTRVAQHRWLPFFLPVVGTLMYVGVSILLVPGALDLTPGENATGESQGGAGSLGIKPSRPPRAAGARVTVAATPPPAAQQPPAAPPQAPIPPPGAVPEDPAQAPAVVPVAN